MNDSNNITNKINELEARLSNLERTIFPGREAPQNNFQKQAIEPRPSGQPISPSDEPNPLVEWLKRDWLMKLGAFLLLLALGWFVTYAFANNWIGPVGRITLGIITGVLIMTGGHFLISKYRNPSQVLMVLGGVMILLTIFAARNLYNFFTPGIALGIMSLVVLAMAVLAIVNNAKSVSVMALLGGLFVPMLTGSHSPDYLALLSYLFVLNLGVLGVVFFRPWRALIAISLLGTGVWSVLAFDHLGDATIWIFMALFFGLFFVSSLASILKSDEVKKDDLLVSALNGLCLLGWIFQYVPREWASLILSGLVVLLVAISYILVNLNKIKPVYINASLAILFLGTATAFELDGSALVTAFSIEVFLIVLFAGFILKMPVLANNFALLHLVPVVLSLPSLEALSRSHTVFNQHFFAILTVTVSLAVSAYLLKRISQEATYMQYFTGILAAVFTVFLIWLTSHNLFISVNAARAVALVIYTIIGVLTFFMGTVKEIKTYTVAGGVLLGAVVLRLLFVEVWDMSLGGRVITFFFIGALLISTAFFQKKFHSSNSSSNNPSSNHEN
ncbi:MAG: DUF2339 domain-containing protein [Patescibacteria group bacterium]